MDPMRRFVLGGAVLAGAVLLFWLLPKGWNGEEILLGQSCALSGPSAELGHGMQVGANALFAEVNAAGGVHGRTVRLITRDDSYEPKLTEANTHEFIDQGVFALFGYVGTPTSRAVLPLLEAHRIPFIAPLTGAGLLRETHNPMIVNIRQGYHEEVALIVSHLLEAGIRRIALFYQNDSYGKSGLIAARSVLEEHSLFPVAEGSYNRNTLAVGHALYEIVPARPEAIIMVDAYKPGATFIRRARQMGLEETLFFHLSFVNSDALMRELSPQESKGVFVSQVVPLPWSDELPLIQEYQQIMARHFPDEPLSFASLEGFIAAQMSVQALENLGRRITREGFVSELRRLKKQEQIDLSITTREGDRMRVIKAPAR